MKTIVTVLLLVTCMLGAAGVAAGSNAAGIDFLQQNTGKPGVVVRNSGLQYKVLRAGAGGFHPAPDTPCECHYAGTLIDGTEFDSSYGRGAPATFAPNQVIKGWTEALQLMVEGDKWELYIPSELGYGDSGSGAKIKGGDVLVFTIELLKLKGDSSKHVPAITCDPISSSDCTAREIIYATRQKDLSPADLSKEIDRLIKLSAAPMSPSLLDWNQRRLNICRKLAQQH